MQKSEDELYDDTFLSQLGWRGFAQSLLYHFPDLPEEICKGNLTPSLDRRRIKL